MSSNDMLITFCTVPKCLILSLLSIFVNRAPYALVHVHFILTHLETLILFKFS